VHDAICRSPAAHIPANAWRRNRNATVAHFLLCVTTVAWYNGRPGAFRAWLRGVTVNLLREHWRARPTAASESVLAQLADPEGGLSRIWNEQHDRHVLHGLMESVRGEFTEPTWRAFRRVALEGVPPREVAAELGLSVNAVLIAKSRVLARLREEASGLVD